MGDDIDFTFLEFQTGESDDYDPTVNVNAHGIAQPANHNHQQRHLTQHAASASLPVNKAPGPQRDGKSNARTPHATAPLDGISRRSTTHCLLACILHAFISCFRSKPVLFSCANIYIFLHMFCVAGSALMCVHCRLFAVVVVVVPVIAEYASWRKQRHTKQHTNTNARLGRQVAWRFTEAAHSQILFCVLPVKASRCP